MTIESTTGAAASAVPSRTAGVPAQRGQGSLGADGGADSAFASLLGALAQGDAVAQPAGPGRLPVDEAAALGPALAAAPETAPAVLVPVPLPFGQPLERQDAQEAGSTAAPALRGHVARAHAGPDVPAPAHQPGAGDGEALAASGAADTMTRHAAPAHEVQAASVGGDAPGRKPVHIAEALGEQEQARVEHGRAARQAELAAPRLVQPVQAGAVASMFEAGLAGLRAATAGRGPERAHDRLSPTHAAGAFLAWTDAPPAGAPVAAGDPVYAPSASALPAALAQRMHVWIAGGVQSAQLQLDAFGAGSVDVRVAVKGDEALVTFHCDQPQARQLLAQAMPQLEELLAREGLVLSGGFVGTSAEQQAGGRDGGREHPIASARTGRAPEAAALAPVGTRARAASGGAVDLFV